MISMATKCHFGIQESRKTAKLLKHSVTCSFCRLSTARLHETHKELMGFPNQDQVERGNYADEPALKTRVMTTPRLIWQKESNPRPFSVWGLRLAQQTEREPQASPVGMPLQSRAQNWRKTFPA
ncbi:MAG: hypothetical protein DRP14_01100 [Candidatus Aenigmatarchaeota archaeon]|nr:MAG: hypothetical protein DRP14_01100 [Candidatus Aenigmarchaeota archaeon]